jgi:phosphopantetheinyl transferase (holo-ACP synthase)
MRLRELEVLQVWVTLTHTDLTAAAVVILERA